MLPDRECPGIARATIPSVRPWVYHPAVGEHRHRTHRPGPQPGTQLDRKRASLLTGLFLTAMATLCLEVLDTRLFSVLTWYHLSFFAVSTAMFGMAAGALKVYLGGAAFEGEEAPKSLARYALLLAVAIPVCHFANLVIPLPPDVTFRSISALSISTIALAIPFYVSGVVVTVALTRIPGKIGLVYAVDLVGAALGSLLVIPLLDHLNATAGVLVCGALAALAAVFFGRLSGSLRPWAPLLLAALLVTGALVHRAAGGDATLFYPKGHFVEPGQIVREYWNVHSQVLITQPPRTSPQYWGEGLGAEGYEVVAHQLVIDGLAGSVITEWDGEPASLEWVKHDVTALPYHLRKQGDVAIIGVGGGRDVLTALWAQSASITGIEINRTFLDLLSGDYREATKITDQPNVRLVHDEARSYLTRTEQRFDVLQMSLIDTWAATTSGAFTLTENGLYTKEAWAIFTRVLKPDGIFSVSRWYAPEQVSETSRLLALGVATLLERGVERPAANMVLVTRKKIATLLLSPSPFSAADLANLRETTERFGFSILVGPETLPENPLLAGIVGSNSETALDAAVEHEIYDISPPTDERPFFFNMLKPGQAFRPSAIWKPGVLDGNTMATSTLLVLASISFLLVLGVILLPLWQSGLPRMEPKSFAIALAYFAAIGLGFMLVQVPFMQRFSVYLGHPTYAVVVILFSMILMTGVGSLLSDRLPVETSQRTLLVFPLLLAAVMFVVVQAIQPVINATIEQGLLLRSLIVIALVAPISVMLGLCFPIGMRLVKRLSDDAMPWMWGVNGACGVLGAVSAVAISMWGGIHLNLYVALLLYASLSLSATALWRAGATESR